MCAHIYHGFYCIYSLTRLIYLHLYEDDRGCFCTLLTVNIDKKIRKRLYIKEKKKKERKSACDKGL